MEAKQTYKEVRVMKMVVNTPGSNPWNVIRLKKGCFPVDYPSCLSSSNLPSNDRNPFHAGRMPPAGLPTESGKIFTSLWKRSGWDRSKGV